MMNQTKPSQHPPITRAAAAAAAAAAASSAAMTTTTTIQQVPLLMTQDAELLGQERFVRRLFLPHNDPSNKITSQSSGLSLESSQETGSQRSNVAVRLSVELNPFGETGGQQEQGPKTANAATSTTDLQLAIEQLDEAADPGAERSCESIRMVDLVDDQTRSREPNGGEGVAPSSSLSSSSGRLSNASSDQMPHHVQPQPVAQQSSQQRRTSAENGRKPQQGPIDDSCNFTFEKVYQRNFLGVNQSFLIAKQKKFSREEIAIRIRSGSGGRAEWLNEIQVYLIPNFRHINVLDYLGSEQSGWAKEVPRRVVREQLPRISDIRKRDYLLDSYDEQKAKESQAAALEKDGAKGGTRIRLQYWLLNRFDSCISLRDYLRERVLGWSEMINIARGIINGLHYLHENGDYQGVDKEQAVKGFIKSTNGRLKRVAFIDKNNMILMWPEHTCSIIHRNLNSMNIVLRGPDLTPCIWNFGHSKILHPFQPTNHINMIDPRLKEVFMSSPYSAPEVLQERSYLTVTAWKAIDMYACGILFWELLSRCRMPELIGANEQENLERCDPDPYYEPFQQEFGPNPSQAMLVYAVCRLHARPKLKDSWLAGKKTYQFAQTIQDLWDQDYDARVHTATVMYRLSLIDLTDEDVRHGFKPRTSKSFDLNTQWPPRVESFQVPPFLDKCEPNLVFLD